MSKNGSKSALTYLGKSWNISKTHRSNSSIFTSKSKEALMKEYIRKAKKRGRGKRTKEQFNHLCNKFGIKQRKNDTALQVIKAKFCGHTNEKERQEILGNVINFKKYCDHYDEIFNLHMYYTLEWYKIDFKKNYPKLFSE